ncbi:hypothetical protein BHM03_00046561 [Ensete ventricosum]|nr:hypothetical protein BHM03_00046561 [Ensete ventricosum]
MKATASITSLYICFDVDIVAKRRKDRQCRYRAILSTPWSKQKVAEVAPGARTFKAPPGQAEPCLHRWLKEVEEEEEETWEVAGELSEQELFAKAEAFVGDFLHAAEDAEEGGVIDDESMASVTELSGLPLCVHFHGKTRTARYIPIRQLTGTRTGRYRVVPLRSAVDGRFPPSAVDLRRN